MTRTYRSPLRDDQARATRRAVVAAAHDLFVDHGYAGATVDMIAMRAGVSRKTVFTAADGAGKAGLLKLALDYALTGDDEPVPVADRPEVIEERAQTDPRRLVQMWAARMSAVEQRAARLALVMAAAADADPEVARIHKASERGRRHGAHLLAEQLETIGGLRADVDRDRASALVHLVSEPIAYQRLVVEAGWTLDDYKGWMEQTLVDAVLRR